MAYLLVRSIQVKGVALVVWRLEQEVAPLCHTLIRHRLFGGIPPRPPLLQSKQTNMSFFLMNNCKKTQYIMHQNSTS